MSQLSGSQIVFLTASGSVMGGALVASDSPIWLFAVVGAVVTAMFVVRTSDFGRGHGRGQESHTDMSPQHAGEHMAGAASSGRPFH